KRPDKIISDRKNLNSYIESIVSEDKSVSKSDPEQFAKDAPFLMKKIDYAQVKDARRRTAARISNEALEEIFYFTALMQFCFTSKN
ncbi:MAG TPA: hypothetical protein PKK43_16380, partial [Spirochaetota bacterium]|nr:hypothetical protein [Spirochaetota bacterium]